MPQSNQAISIENNFYTEKLVPGAYPLTKLHIHAIKASYPKQADFIDKMAAVLSKDGLSVQACLLANFVVAKSMFDDNHLSAYSAEGIKASEIKFSFVSYKNGTLARFETLEQQIVRRSFLTFNMRSANREQVSELLGEYGLGMVTMDNCGCCGVREDDIDKLTSSKLYQSQNVLRSAMSAQAIPTQLVAVGQLKDIDADISVSDIIAMKELKRVIHQLAKIDLAEGVSAGNTRAIEDAGNYIAGIYSN